jgi:hypothetical protein
LGDKTAGANEVTTMTKSSALTVKRVVLAVGLLVLAHPQTAASAQEFRTPSEIVDEFHKAVGKNDSMRALSLLTQDSAVYEFGQIDPNLAQYIQNAPMTSWALESRRMGGAGDQFWVLSTYRVSGADKNGTAINDIVLETMIVRRLNGQFRIAHFHWSATPAV